MGVTINPPPGSISKLLHGSSTSSTLDCSTAPQGTKSPLMYNTIAAGVESAPIEVPLQPWLGSEEEETDA